MKRISLITIGFFALNITSSLAMPPKMQPPIQPKKPQPNALALKKMGQAYELMKKNRNQIQKPK